MAPVDPVYEILEFAINREVEAFEFYKALATRVESSAMRQLLEVFASEELEHKEKLELEMMKRGAVVKEIPKSPEAVAVANLKISDYMVDTGGYLDLNYEDSLILGMKKEKASFRLYIDLAEMIEDKETHETLLLLAEEEARHKMRFEIEYDNLLLKRDE